MAKDNSHTVPGVYRELKGKTYEERVRECPPGYWCYQPLKDGAPDEGETTEVWADPHGMYCPVCKTNCVDTGPWPSFMCPNCGLSFEVEMFPLEVSGRKVVLTHPQ